MICKQYIKNSVHGGGVGGVPGQVPPGRYTPSGQVHTPPEQCMLGDTGNKRAVRILLECILVLDVYCLIEFNLIFVKTGLPLHWHIALPPSAHR